MTNRLLSPLAWLPLLLATHVHATDEVTLKPGLAPAPTVSIQELERPSAGTEQPESSRSFYEKRKGETSEPAPSGLSSAFERVEREADALAGVSNSCRLQILERLGWKLDREAGRTRFRANGGNPCMKSSIAETRAAGELQLQLPPDDGAAMDPAEVTQYLNDLLLSKPSICAYKFPVARAVQVASARLVDNDRFEFFSGDPMVDFYGSDIPWFGGCYSRRGTMQCFTARYTPSRALRQFTHGHTRTECAIGLQVAEFEMLHQIFGDDGFDRFFDRKEIVIGPWGIVRQQGSATWGRSNYAQTFTDKFAEEATETGPGWFVGVSGYIGNVFGERYLDRPVDRGENFLTVEVSVAAAQQLRDLGGFSGLNKNNRRIWDLANGMGDKARELAGNSESLDRYQMSDSLRTRILTIRQILQEPVYSEYQVFVHPLKIMSFGGHIARLLRLNPRTPYAMSFYPSRLHGGLYRRYLQSLAASCTN